LANYLQSLAFGDNLQEKVYIFMRYDTRKALGD